MTTNSPHIKRMMTRAIHRQSKDVFFLKDSTPVMPSFLITPRVRLRSLRNETNPLLPMEDELTKLELAFAFGMMVGEFSKWRKRNPTFPKPTRLQSKNVIKERGLNTSILVTDFWNVEEVFEWIEANLADPATQP